MPRCRVWYACLRLGHRNRSRKASISSGSDCPPASSAAPTLPPPDRKMRIKRGPLRVALYGSGVWETELTVGAGGEGVGDQGGLGRPPTIDSCFANVRVGGDAFNAQFRQSTMLFKQLQGAAQNGLTRFLTARPPGRAFPVGPVASVPRAGVSRLGVPGMVWSHR